jgi:uncharacterized lipoprotein YmbA
MKPYLIAALALLLSACAGQIVRVPAPVPPVNEMVRSRYQGIEVLDVSLPTYASGEEIFTEDGAGMLVGSANMIWADDPTRATTLSLTRALSQITGAQVAPEPWPFDQYPSARVDVRVEDMRALGGLFTLSGQYFVAPLNGGRGTARLFNVTAPLPQAPTLSDFAAARSSTVAQLALQIARDGLR